MSYARRHHYNELKANGKANLVRLSLMSSRSNARLKAELADT
jgi:hypothetical protein